MVLVQDFVETIRKGYSFQINRIIVLEPELHLFQMELMFRCNRFCIPFLFDNKVKMFYRFGNNRHYDSFEVDGLLIINPGYCALFANPITQRLYQR